MTLILGKSVATAKQMATYLLSVNKTPKFSRSISVEDFCQLFLDVCAKEGVRGDIAFSQSLKETGNFNFKGDVKYTQNNFAGIGATGGGVCGCVFKDIETGILAQAQHLKTYATKDALNEPCVDPRRTTWFVNAKGGTSPNVETLGGTWAVPGYSTSKYSSLEAANAAKDSYGYQIISILNKILKIDIKEETTMSKPVIAISAGHGLYVAGKRCMKALDPNETREWFLNDRIADKVEQKLGAYNCKVIRVNDTTGKTDTALSTRITISNTANADIYLAIHHNAGVNGGSGGGTVVFYYPTGNNKDIATKLYNHIISYTGLKGNRSKAIASTTSLYEVRKPKAKALLIENGFMDSSTDVPIILTEEHAEKTAIGIVNFFIEYFGLTKNGATVTPTTPTSSTTLYRVRKSWDKPSTQVGAFSSFEKAKSVCKSGYYVFDENGNILYPEINNTSSTYTHKDFVKEVQAAIGAKVDGIAGNETLSKTVTVSKTKNRKHAVVKPIQKYLNSQGYNAGNADGVAGVKFDTALKAFQKANGCVADGEATAQKSTWKKLLKL